MNSESRRERMLRLGEIRFRNLITCRGGVYSTEELSTLLDKPAKEIVEMALTRQLIVSDPPTT